MYHLYYTNQTPEGDGVRDRLGDDRHDVFGALDALRTARPVARDLDRLRVVDRRPRLRVPVDPHGVAHTRARRRRRRDGRPRDHGGLRDDAGRLDAPGARALSAASRPFSADRDGFVLGEGAWMFVLEDLERARARGARVYAEMRGYGATCDAHHRVRLDESGEEPARAMTLALEEAGASPRRHRLRRVSRHRNALERPRRDAGDAAGVRRGGGDGRRAPRSSR